MPRCCHLIVVLTAGLSLAGGDQSTLAADGAVDQPVESVEEKQKLQERATALVRQLGDGSFQIRRQAAQDLLKLGLPALSALQRATDSSDLEIRYRARRLIKEVRLSVQEQQLERYLADSKSVADGQLPGLKRFRKAVGDDLPARKLFVEMQRAEPRLFLILEDDPKLLSGQFESRCARVRYAMASTAARKRLVATASALMFIAADPRVATTERAGVTVYNLANYNEFRIAMTADPELSPVRKLVAHWVSAETGGGAQQRLLLALRNNLPGGIIPALATLKAKARGQDQQYALLAVGRFGTPEHIPAVEKLFDRRTILTQSRGKRGLTFSSELRDVALAVAVHLRGQDAKKEYGFQRVYPHAQYLFSPNSIGFGSEAQRTAAFQKWSTLKDGGNEKP